LVPNAKDCVPAYGQWSILGREPDSREDVVNLGTKDELLIEIVDGRLYLLTSGVAEGDRRLDGSWRAGTIASTTTAVSPSVI
jgi:hypothetical protein